MSVQRHLVLGASWDWAVQSLMSREGINSSVNLKVTCLVPLLHPLSFMKKVPQLTPSVLSVNGTAHHTAVAGRGGLLIMGVSIWKPLLPIAARFSSGGLIGSKSNTVFLHLLWLTSYTYSA